MQTLDIPSSVANRAVPVSKVQTVLVKFFFTNPKHIPWGIPERKVSDRTQKQIDEFNSFMAEVKGNATLGQVGRRREGRVDTGEQVINNLQFVQLGIIRRGLTNVGFQLRTVDAFFIPQKGKHVVCLVFQKGGFYEEATATPTEKEAHKLLNSSAIVSALRELANTTWQWCHGWDNSATRKTMTINVGGRLPDAKPRHAIAVRQGEVLPIELTATLNESDE